MKVIMCSSSSMMLRLPLSLALALVSSVPAVVRGETPAVVPGRALKMPAETVEERSFDIPSADGEMRITPILSRGPMKR